MDSCQRRAELPSCVLWVVGAPCLIGTQEDETQRPSNPGRSAGVSWPPPTRWPAKATVTTGSEAIVGRPSPRKGGSCWVLDSDPKPLRHAQALARGHGRSSTWSKPRGLPPGPRQDQPRQHKDQCGRQTVLSQVHPHPCRCVPGARLHDCDDARGSRPTLHVREPEAGRADEGLRRSFRSDHAAERRHGHLALAAAGKSSGGRVPALSGSWTRKEQSALGWASGQVETGGAPSCSG